MEAVRRNNEIKAGNSTSNSNYNTFDSSKIKLNIYNNDVTQPNPNERNVYWGKKIRKKFSHNNNNSSLTDTGNHQNNYKRGTTNCFDSKLLSAEGPARNDKLNEIKCYNDNFNRNTNPHVFERNNAYQRYHRGSKENKSNPNNYYKNKKIFPKLLPTATAGSRTIIHNSNIKHNNHANYNSELLLVDLNINENNSNIMWMCTYCNYWNFNEGICCTNCSVSPATAVVLNDNLDMQWICANCNYWNMNVEICEKCSKLHDSSDIHELLNEIKRVCPTEVLEHLRVKVNNEWLCRICNNLNSAIKECQKCNKEFDKYDAFVTLEFVASLKYLTAGVELKQAKPTSCNAVKSIKNTKNNRNNSTNTNTNNSTNTNSNNSRNTNTNNSKNTNTNNSTSANTNNNTNNNSKIEVQLDSSTPNVSNTTSTSLSTEADDIVLLRNYSKFDCIICLNECEPIKGIVLHECFHSYCRGCATKLIMKSCTSIIKCSDINGNGIRCDGTFQPKEIEALLSKKRYEKYSKRCLAEVEMTLANTIHCNTTNCIGFTIMEIGDTNYVCQICRKLNCIPCKAIHESSSCEEYKKTNKSKEIAETEKKLQLLIETGDAMVCPMCDIYLSKSEGCDGMSCSYCETEICWITKQARWGPKGRGDISGGCRCNVNNIKCHVLCDTCH